MEIHYTIFGNQVRCQFYVDAKFCGMLVFDIDVWKAMRLLFNNEAVFKEVPPAIQPTIKLPRERRHWRAVRESMCQNM